MIINLWALSQCFQSRSPLPQYLPSPRTALEGLMESVDDPARSFRRATRSGDGVEGLHGGGKGAELAICTVWPKMRRWVKCVMP